MVAKKSLKYAGTFGLAQTLCGTVWVDRSSAKGRKAINDAGKHSKETGTSLFLFPEGEYYIRLHLFKYLQDFHENTYLNSKETETLQ